MAAGPSAAPSSKSRARAHAPRRPAEGASDPVGITFSALDRASIVTLSRDRRTATCSKGYRMIKATAGVSSGAWFFEVAVSPDLKPGAHCRLGWSTELGESHGPVGYSQHSYGYRDEGGVRVHQSIRYKYGAPYGAGSRTSGLARLIR